MIYLTFDSNIWIYSLDESWQIENHLDYLEPWIQEEKVKLLLPKMIIDEWGKHEEKQAEEREKKLGDFFNMAEEILPSAFFAEYKEPAIQRKIIDEHLLRARNLILKSDRIPDYQETIDRVITDGIAKKAPLHKKSSIADAIIIFSLIKYASKNPGNHYYFISYNKEDFYKTVNNKSQIHPDLEPDFKAFNIQAFSKFDKSFIYQISRAHGLVINELDIRQKRKDRIKNKVKEKIYNPAYDKIIESGKNSYVQNINTIEYILKESRPTKEQVVFVFALIDSDTAYERDFYKRLTNRNWFEVLERKGVFSPQNNPAPIQMEEGFQIPLWEPLLYLQNLSLQIKDGYGIELIDEIISIINIASTQPVDNHRTWYMLIKILSNLPNEKIPLATLDFIPTWLEGRFDTVLQSSELCENLLPKFLTDNPSFDDIKKAELILKHLLSIEKIEDTSQDAKRMETESYQSRVHLHYLSDALIDKKLTQKIVAYCSEKIIIELADTLKKLRFDFPRGINVSLKIKENEYNIESKIDNESLNIIILEKKNSDKIITTSSIEKFESLTKEETRDSIITVLHGAGIEYEENKDNEFNLRMLINGITNGSHHSFSEEDAISKLNDHYQYGDKAVEVFSLIFRDLLNDKVKQNPKTGVSLLKLFAFERRYRPPFFLRVVLFVIGENWEVCRNLFWDMIQDNDPMLIFSNHTFDKDLYELLNKNQIILDKKDIESLQKIIDSGPQHEKDDQDPTYNDYWRLRWYAALRDIEPFKAIYEKLSISENLTHEHYEELGVVKIRTGSISPFSMEEILQKSNKEIVKFIHDFKPKDRWEEPTIDGLSNALGKAVEAEPQKFSEEIELYKDVHYIYAYQIAYGFKEAWKNKKPFDWEKVLNFFLAYVSGDKFTSGQLRLENDGWRATADLVSGAVGSLLTEGMQSDKNAFDLSLLPTAMNIIKILIKNLKSVDDFKQTNMDYPTYSLNSTAGRTLRSLLDYSLRRARNLKSEDNSPKWEQDVRSLFEDTFKKGIIDGYVLAGWHFQQFYFLDNEWIINKIKNYNEYNDNEWVAFLSGLVFSNPPFNKDIYQLFYPHYERAIKKDVQIKSFYDRGIIRHIVAFYFWGFEDLNIDGLLLMLIHKGNLSDILELVNFVWRQKDYLTGLTLEEAKKIETKIFNLWSFLANKYGGTTDEEEQKILVKLSNLLVFAPKLNAHYTELVLKSSGITDKRIHTHTLIETLAKLKDQGNPDEVAKYMGIILNSIHFTSYFATNDKKYIIELVVFLYENGQKEVADDFCNKMVKQGHEFFIELHNRYKD